MIAIIDYKSGNVASVKNALERLGVDSVVTNKADDISLAKGVIFPGQGRAAVTMNQLKKDGLVEVISSIKVPFLGICLGMQLMCEFSEEDNVQGLSIVKGNCKRLSEKLRVPHLGWNKVMSSDEDDLFKGITTGEYFYFAHSYYVDVADSLAIAKVSYGFSFAAAVKEKNFYGVQFHPEKSCEVGMQVLSNFCKLCF